MKESFNLGGKLAKRLTKTQTISEEVEEVEGFSERKYKQIDGEWYEAQTYNIGTIKDDEDTFDLIEDRVASFVRENFRGKKVYFMMVDVSYAMEDDENPIIMRVIVNDDDFKVEGQNEVGDLNDLIATIKEHENYFQHEYEMLDLGYSFGNMELSQQLEALNQGESLQKAGEMWSAFYLDTRSEPDDIDTFLSEDEDALGEDEEFHMELESRSFIKKDDGKIYEFV